MRACLIVMTGIYSETKWSKESLFRLEIMRLDRYEEKRQTKVKGPTEYCTQPALSKSGYYGWTPNQMLINSSTETQHLVKPTSSQRCFSPMASSVDRNSRTEKPRGGRRLSCDPGPHKGNPATGKASLVPALYRVRQGEKPLDMPEINENRSVEK